MIGKASKPQDGVQITCSSSRAENVARSEQKPSLRFPPRLRPSPTRSDGRPPAPP